MVDATDQSVMVYLAACFIPGVVCAGNRICQDHGAIVQADSQMSQQLTLPGD